MHASLKNASKEKRAFKLIRFVTKDRLDGMLIDIDAHAEEENARDGKQPKVSKNSEAPGGVYKNA